MKGSGRAFCAGGDVVGLRQIINEGQWVDPVHPIITFLCKHGNCFHYIGHTGQSIKVSSICLH